MNNRCVISVFTDRSLYLKWGDRLVDSLAPYVDVLAWRNLLPPDSATHEDVPYGFKPASFLAAQSEGYTSILWCDSPIWAKKDPAPIFDLIERDGYCFFRNGFNCGQWCTDAALKHHGLTRDEAMLIPDFTGCCMGLDFTNARGREFFNRWNEAAHDGVSFQGAWTNEKQQCSCDPRCRGHRHDQVIGSIIAHKMGLKLTDCGSTEGSLFSYNAPNLPESVCLVSGR